MAKIIVGLGNPLPEYDATYHNVGMLALKHMANELKNGGEPLVFKPHKKLFEYALAGGTALVLPLTFMNESGTAVKEAMKKFGAAVKDLVVIHDESDLPVGTYKMSSERGAAGHKGAQSIMDALRSKEFLRVRIGIRDKNEKKRKKASEFVLKKITPKDMKTLRTVFFNLTSLVRE